LDLLADTNVSAEEVRGITKKLMAQIKKFPAFMKTEGSLPCSEEAATDLFLAR
jgi:hypothetical protein